MKLRVFTAFSGYDSQCLALDRLKANFPNFDYELVGWSEIDKYAIKAHNALFPQWADRNYGDISKIDWSEVPNFDLFTYSSPCQDFSSAGTQKGGEEGSGTRSSLLWECRRAIVAKRPKYLLLENVAALVQKKFLPLFNKWQSELTSYGYTNFAQVLNAKDYGVPQNRKRVFLVSILGEASYRFPTPFPLERRLKDVLERNVDEKYYLSEKMLEYFNRTSKDTSHRHSFKPRSGEDTAFAITTSPGTRVDGNFIQGPFDDNDRVIQIGNIYPDTPTFKNRTMGRIYSIEGLTPTLNTCGGGGGREPKIIEDMEEVRIISRPHGYNVGGRKDIAPTCTGSAYQDNNLVEYCIGSKQANAYVGTTDGVSPTITAACGMGGGQTPMVTERRSRIRKFTPRDCFRLMGVDDKDIDTIQSAGISNSQQYKMAGNSIVVDVLYHIFRSMFCENNNKPQQLTLF